MPGFVTVSSDWSGGTWPTPGFSLDCCVIRTGPAFCPIVSSLGHLRTEDLSAGVLCCCNSIHHCQSVGSEIGGGGFETCLQPSIAGWPCLP